MRNRVVKNVQSLNVVFADNGYMLEYSGYDDNDDYQDAKHVVTSLEDLFAEIKMVAETKR